LTLTKYPKPKYYIVGLNQIQMVVRIIAAAAESMQVIGLR